MPGFQIFAWISRIEWDILGGLLEVLPNSLYLRLLLWHTRRSRRGGGMPLSARHPVSGGDEVRG